MSWRLAFRRLRVRPVVSLAVVLAMAIALAVDASLFSVLDGLVYPRLPFDRPESLVAVVFKPVTLVHDVQQFVAERQAVTARFAHSPLVVGETQAGAGDVFDVDQARLLGLDVEGVDARFFALFGLRPELGRSFTAEDEASASIASPSSPRPVRIVIGHQLWQQLYGGAPGVLGVHNLAGRSVDIIGVMGPSVKFPDETNIWAPVPSTRPVLPAYVRLAPDVTVATLASAFPQLEFTAIEDVARAGSLRALPLLFGGSLGLLLVAWVQVAALRLSATVGEIDQYGLRLALGASRLSAIAATVAESAVAAGAAFGLAVWAIWPLTSLMVRLLPADLARGHYLAPDWRTLAFGGLVTLIGFAVLAGTPLYVLRTRSPVDLLRFSGRQPAPRGLRLREALTVGQIAVTVSLLYVAGLALHSYRQALVFDYGIDIDHLLIFRPPAWLPHDMPPKQSLALFEQFGRNVRATADQLDAVPGVVAASEFGFLPMGFGLTSKVLLPVVRFDVMPRSDVRVRRIPEGRNFVNAVGARVLAGRGFDASSVYSFQDDPALVNETMVRQLAGPIAGLGVPAPSVLGRRIDLGGNTSYRIVGVIQDIVSGPGISPEAQLFNLDDGAIDGVAIRTTGPIDDATPAIRASLQRVWGPLRPGALTTMQRAFESALQPYQAQSRLLEMIAACCLPIAVLGLAGALTYGVATRRREIAVRIALGADPSGIARSVVRRSLGVVGLGALVGILTGLIVWRLAGHEFFGVHAADPFVIAAVVVTLGVFGWMAAALPARQASLVDPAVVLREP